MEHSADSSQIFLCHSSEDGSTAQQVEEELSDAGADVWAYYSALEGGKYFPTLISSALDRCQTLVLLWSEKAQNSKWVEREWSSGLALHKDVIPCRLDATPLPAVLAGALSVDFKDIDKGIDLLCQSLNLVRPVKAERLKAAARRAKYEGTLESVRSPMVGTVYRGAGAEEPPLFKVGDHVRQGETLYFIEAMMELNEIEAPYTGEIVQIFVESGAPVEYNQLVFAIRRTAEQSENRVLERAAGTVFENPCPNCGANLQEHGEPMETGMLCSACGWLG
jgi:biotin carboxyl carrier protein